MGGTDAQSSNDENPLMALGTISPGIDVMLFKQVQVHG